jgi:hypothetical protein
LRFAPPGSWYFSTLHDYRYRVNTWRDENAIVLKLFLMAKKKAVDPAMVSAVMAEMGRRGGTARGEGLRAGTVELSGAAVPKPTVCPRCGETQPSARAAWVHCRKPKAKKAGTKKKAGK